MGLNPVAMKTDESFPARLTGLSESEAQARLAADGPNELPQPDRRTPLRIVLEVLREPMFALLIGGGVSLSRAGRPHGGADPAGLRPISI